MGDDRSIQCHAGHGRAAAALKDSFRCETRIAGGMLVGCARVHDVADRPCRRRRGDYRVDRGARPAEREVPALRAHAVVGARARGNQHCQILDRLEHLTRHLGRARVDEHHAVGADRGRDVRAVGDEHVDVALHGQHVDVAVARRLRSDPCNRIDGAGRDREVTAAIVAAGHIARVNRLGAAARGFLGDPVLSFQPLRHIRILTWQEVRHEMRVVAAHVAERRCYARLHGHGAVDIERVVRRLHEGLGEVDRVIDDLRNCQEFVVPRQILGDRIHIARLRPAALQESVFDVRRRHDERVADPLARRKTGPGVRRICGRMGAAVEIDLPVQGAPELHVIGHGHAGQRVKLLDETRAADAAPLMRHRVRPATKLRRAPKRLCRRVGAQTSGVVERHAEVVAVGRLSGILVDLPEPFSGQIRLRKIAADQDLCGSGPAGGEREYQQSRSRAVCGHNPCQLPFTFWRATRA